MRETMQRLVAVALVAGLSASAALAADVNIGINLGTPPPVVVAPAPAVVVTPPSIVLSAPPALVVVPGTPVQYVPTAGFNLFVFGGRYYSFHNGHWFHAGHYNGPWAHIKTEKVPRAVIGVPVTYYPVPPGHAKKHQGAEAPCPPGQAKKGRC